MKHIMMYMKSVRYSFRLLYRSSGWMFLIFFLLELVCATVPLFSAFVLKRLLDVLATEDPDITAAMFCVGLYMAVLIALQAVNSAKNIVNDSVLKKAGYLYDHDLSEKLSKLPMSVIDSSEGRDKADFARYTQDVALRLSYRILEILSLLYTFSVAFGTLVAFNIWFSMLFLVLSIPGAIMDTVFSWRSMELRQRTAPDVRKFCYYRWMLTDPWPAKDVRMYDLTAPIKTRYENERDRYMKENGKLDRKELLASLSAELIMRSGEIAFTVYVVLKALSGELGVGDVALYIGFSVSAASAFQRVTSILLSELTEGTELMGEAFSFLSISCPDEDGGKRILKSFESLVFDDVYFKYPLTDRYVLSGVSFTLNRGDRLSIVGINGSGKSTIVKLMIGLYEAESGQILLNGYPLSDYDIWDVRRMFSVLFQEFAQYPVTLRDNIALSDYGRADDDEGIVKALQQSGAYGDLETRLKDGLDTQMTRQFDDNGIELSKGQWQKVVLSRAYFKEASIVIFDEPSAALDAEAEDRIFQNFEEISGDRTGIMISHRISSARMSDKIIVIDGGKIAENGTHRELVALGGLYAKLYCLQKEKYVAEEEKGHE